MKKRKKFFRKIPDKGISIRTLIKSILFIVGVSLALIAVFSVLILFQKPVVKEDSGGLNSVFSLGLSLDTVLLGVILIALGVLFIIVIPAFFFGRRK